MAYQPLSSFRLFASALYGLDIKNRAYIRHHLFDIGSFFIIVECRKSHTPDDRQRFHQHLMNADCLGHSFHHLQDLYIHHRLHEQKELPAHECGRRPQAQRHLTFLPDAVTSHAKTPVPAEAQNLQGKELAIVDVCRFKVLALKRPQSSFADWYSKERRQRES